MLNRGEAAERLHVSQMTVRRLAMAGHLTKIRVGKRTIRVTEDSVEARIAARCVTRDSEGSDAA
jgi:excisionase family DNA binding protein